MTNIKFNDLKLSTEVLKGIDTMGYTTPSPIQEKAIPLLLEGKDVIGQAQTGTGKTLAFGSVLLSEIVSQNKAVSALVLSPTRELAIQIQEELKRIGKFSSLKITSVYGGSDIERQIKDPGILSGDGIWRTVQLQYNYTVTAVNKMTSFDKTLKIPIYYTS